MFFREKLSEKVVDNVLGSLVDIASHGWGEPKPIGTRKPAGMF